MAIASRWVQAGDSPEPEEVARQLGHGIAASDSCVTALYVATRFLHLSFEEMLRFVARGGGDVDTISAMAGAVWGAARGAQDLSQALLSKLEQKDHLKHLALALHVRASEAFQAPGVDQRA